MTASQAPITHVGAHRDADHGRIREALTVERIMTSRAAFRCCAASARVGDAFRDVPEEYDALPVVEDAADDPASEVIGVLWRREAEQGSPRDLVASLMDERAVESPLPADLPMIDYARGARADRMSFVARDGAILGLVTLYDLERLPVRLAVFQHILHLEERLGEMIAAQAEPETWPDLAPGRAEAIRDGLKHGRSREHLGSPILSIGFREKLEIADTLLRRLPGSGSPSFGPGRIAGFRNDIAHGAPFRDVAEVPQRIREIDALLDTLTSPRPAAGT